MADDSPQTRPASPRRRWRRGLVVAVLLILLVLAAIACRGSRRPPSPPPTLPSERLGTVTPGVVGPGFSVLPGGTHVLVGGRFSGHPAEIVRASDGAVRPCPLNWPRGSVGQPASPDGMLWWVFLCCRGGCELGLWDAGRRSCKWAHLPTVINPYRAAAAPRGRSIAFAVARPAGGHDLMVIRSADGQLQHLALGTVPSQLADYDQAFDWSPDGRRVAANMPGGRLLIAEPATGASMVVQFGPPLSRPHYAQLAWLRNDSVLVFSGIQRKGSGPEPATLARVDLPDGTVRTIWRTDDRSAPWPLGRRPGQLAEVELCDASGDGRWFVARVRWTEHSRFGERLYGNIPWLLRRFPRTRKAGDRLASHTNWHSALFVFGADGRPRWQPPPELDGVSQPAFLADGRLCWSTMAEVRTARLPAERGASQRRPSP